jgi:hypothetical protein
MYHEKCHGAIAFQAPLLSPHIQVKKIYCGGKTFTIGYDPDAWMPTPITGKSIGFHKSILSEIFFS